MAIAGHWRRFSAIAGHSPGSLMFATTVVMDDGSVIRVEPDQDDGTGLLVVDPDDPSVRYWVNDQPASSAGVQAVIDRNRELRRGRP